MAGKVTRLKAEHHVHLFGCLTAEDIFEIGEKSRDHCQERLEWYADEYEKAYGRLPDWRAYWQGKKGLALLKRDFLFLQRAPFPKFQASFNLIIALCKVGARDGSIIKRVFGKLRDQGLTYVEARTVLPPYIQGDDKAVYLETLAKTTLAMESKDFTPRLALSIPREAPHTEQVYETLRSWMDDHPDLAAAFSAIDLAFFEEHDPPKGKRRFVERVLADNRTRRDKLALLYHVGESFNTISAASSARWVWEAASMGATRLGHAISLGIGPSELKTRSVRERVQERSDHVEWLLRNEGWLTDYGYPVDTRRLTSELVSLGKRSPEENVAITYDDTYLADFKLLQDALMKHLKDVVDPVIECCPTSNARIGMIKDLKNHPLKRFVEAGLKVCISTDDPGIFDITLDHEEELAVSEIGLSVEQLERIAAEEGNYRSSVLCEQQQS